MDQPIFLLPTELYFIGQGSLNDGEGTRYDAGNLDMAILYETLCFLSSWEPPTSDQATGMFAFFIGSGWETVPALDMVGKQIPNAQNDDIRPDIGFVVSHIEGNPCPAAAPTPTTTINPSPTTTRTSLSPPLGTQTSSISPTPSSSNSRSQSETPTPNSPSTSSPSRTQTFSPTPAASSSEYPTHYIQVPVQWPRRVV